jgi:hypothetical protein
MWTVELQDTTYDMSLFSRIQEQEGGMTMELGDDATYPVRGVGSISFQCLQVMFLSWMIFYLFLV